MDTLYWQVSIDHNMDVQNQSTVYVQIKGACFSQPVSWSMAAMLRDSSVAAIVRVYPQAKPLAMTTMKNQIMGFL